ncbi:hypothetical protein IQ06DRAFT_294664 [Phaeosphaeriaceae sp. SRC1lsM3a]|nr:hypothetical protein IQ06DRAFT_294664 [Stagonospora sp. SRC1lsM3a]
MSTTVDIPEEFVPMGLMWQKLPLELVWEILLYTWMLEKPYCTPGRVFDKTRFDIINRLTRFTKIRSLGKTFSVQCMQLIYLNNDFVFKASHIINSRSELWLSLPPPLPPLQYRGYLRRVQIHLVLEDFYSILQPGNSSKLNCIPFRTPDELLKYSPGAKLLQDLTSAGKGFPNLELLDLHIHVELRFNAKGESFALIKAAAFTVRARDVMVSSYEQGVAELIKVELRE